MYLNWFRHYCRHRYIDTFGPVKFHCLPPGATVVVMELIASIGLPQLLLVAAGVVVFAAVLRAFTGFGFGLAAVPVFALLMSPEEAVVLSVSLTLAVSLLTVRTYWGQASLRPMAGMLLLALVGTVIGRWPAARLSAPGSSGCGSV